MKINKGNYAIRVGESDYYYTYRKAYACSIVYNNKIDILSDGGKLIQHSSEDTNFTIIINPYRGLMELLGFEIIE